MPVHVTESKEDDTTALKQLRCTCTKYGATKLRPLLTLCKIYSPLNLLLVFHFLIVCANVNVENTLVPYSTFDKHTLYTLQVYVYLLYSAN